MSQIKLNKATTDFYKEMHERNEFEKNLKQVITEYIMNNRSIDKYESLIEAYDDWNNEIQELKLLSLNGLLYLAITSSWFLENTQVIKVKDKYYVWFSDELTDLMDNFNKKRSFSF